MSHGTCANDAWHKVTAHLCARVQTTHRLHWCTCANDASVCCSENYPSLLKNIVSSKGSFATHMCKRRIFCTGVHVQMTPLRPLHIYTCANCAMLHTQMRLHLRHLHMYTCANANNASVHMAHLAVRHGTSVHVQMTQMKTRL